MIEYLDGIDLILHITEIVQLRVRADHDAGILEILISVGDDPRPGPSSQTTNLVAPVLPVRAGQITHVVVSRRSVENQRIVVEVRVFPDLNPAAFSRHDGLPLQYSCRHVARAGGR